MTDTHIRPRPTDEEFDALKRKRDDSVAELVAKVCEKQGWDKSKIHVHNSHSGECYCACPDGPCQHIWDGPEYADDAEGGGFMSSTTCSRCGAVAAYHDMKVMP